MKILVTGAAGFIGYHLCEKLLENKFSIIALDNINDYYDVNLKLSRLKNLGINTQKALIFNQYVKSDLHGEDLIFIRMNLEDTSLKNVFSDFKISTVCNLAAQAGVRYSIENPKAYIDSNIIGFSNILECCRNFSVKRLVYASSSSVYGKNKDVPFEENQNVDNPISLYAASKKSNELMAYTYSHLYGFETIGLRFFTVYGPWGRPDMALFLFTKAIFENKKINVYNYGNHSRDFTYIDDIVEGVYNTISKDSKNSDSYKLYNIGNSKPVELMDFINLIEKNLGKKANKKMLPMQAGDVEKTYASTVKLSNDYDYTPKTPIDFGVKSFIDWYVKYYNINE
tara:strand:- start:6758 stop:7777 length:1020 start_codon:yes stop_codon:yes gene_type:complete